MNSEIGKTLSYCESQVRAHDRDRYLLGLSAGRRASELFPLFAFNYEIARTRETVSEPPLGLIRLQWWRDALGAHYAGRPVPRHEVLDALVPVVTRHNLPEDLFMVLLEAREADLENTPPRTTGDFIAYADKTVRPLNMLALKILGQNEDPKTISDISIAYALAGLLRVAPWHAAQERQYLPADLMASHGMTLQDIKKSHPGLRPVVDAVLGMASDRLRVRPQGRFLRASRRLTQTYMRRLEKYPLDDERQRRPPVGFMLRVLLRAF